MYNAFNSLYHSRKGVKTHTAHVNMLSLLIKVGGEEAVNNNILTDFLACLCYPWEISVKIMKTKLSGHLKLVNSSCFLTLEGIVFYDSSSSS